MEEVVRPELYDFLFGSGVVRLDDGVTLFRGIIEGEGTAERGLIVNPVSCCVGDPRGIGGGCGMRDILFIRLASVGLMVLAPNPVACDGIIDILFDDVDDGVAAPSLFFTGVLTPVFDEARVVVVPGARLSPAVRGGGCSDLAL